jgi:hypothetical protein
MPKWPETLGIGAAFVAAAVVLFFSIRWLTGAPTEFQPGEDIEVA